MDICFTLKRNVTISVPFLSEAEEPFQYIDNVEEHIPKLFHLGGVDFLVVENFGRHITPSASHKQYSEEIDCEEALERYDVVVYNLH